MDPQKAALTVARFVHELRTMEQGGMAMLMYIVSQAVEVSEALMILKEHPGPTASELFDAFTGTDATAFGFAQSVPGWSPERSEKLFDACKGALLVAFEKEATTTLSDEV